MKLKYLIFILFLLLNSFCSNANDTLTKKFVWAIHGLNVRSSPSINSNKVETLLFGDSITILETTDISYSKKLIDTFYSYNKPIYLKCTWVKIKSGKSEGYVVSGYLLEIPCPKQNETINEYGRRMATKFINSKLKYTLPIDQGVVVGNSFQCEFPNRKKLGFLSEKDEKKRRKELESNSEQEGQGEDGYFKGFTLQEVLTILNRFYGIEEASNNYQESSYKVYLNEPNRILLDDKSTQKIAIYIYESGEIIFLYENSGC